MIFFEILLLIFLGAAFSLIVFMAVYLLVRGRWRRKYVKWNNMIDLLIRKAIFFYEGPTHDQSPVPLTTRMKTSLHNRRFRNRLRTKIVSARKSMSGQSADNLKKLYLQLEMDQDALEMIRSHKWHLIAAGLQQLGIFGLKEHLNEVNKFTNHKNELVRIEAQIAVLNLYGFEGLQFLDTITYQISEWQQIKLLKELSSISHVDLRGINLWLKSSNPSVVIFALKLARNYHHFELYDDIVWCLQHPDPSVRFQAIVTLSDIFTGDTSKQLLGIVEQEDISNQLAIMKAVGKIGDDDDVPALMKFLDTDNLELKMAVARAIANIGPNAMSSLLADPAALVYPLNEMIPQIKTEVRI